MFSPQIGWGGVCSFGWTPSNTKVACRQLGFLDGAGTYQSTYEQPVTFTLFNVRCSGNENSLFDCAYSTTSTQSSCIDPVYIRCECSHCPELLLEAPQQKDATTQSAVIFEWLFRHNISDFEILFLSQKNPQTLAYVEQGKVIEENTRFKHRVQLINDDYTTVGFNLTNITVADMGIYHLYVPKLLLTSKAILIVTDFAEVPDPEIHRQVGDSIVLSWDLTALRKLRDINHEILLTTPATGRIHLSYYYTQWLRDNPHRHSVSQPRDHLHPTVIIDNVTVSDAGNYVIEVMLTSSVHRWLNASWQFVTDLVVAADNSSDIALILLIPTGNTGSEAAIALGVLLGISMITVVLLVVLFVYLYRRRINHIRQLESEVNSLRVQRRAPTSVPMANLTGQEGQRGQENSYRPSVSEDEYGYQETDISEEGDDTCN